MLEKKTQINELYNLRHLHDDLPKRHYPWENELLSRTTVPYIWKNPRMNNFMKQIQKLCVVMLESMNLSRNFWNISVNKYYNDHAT